MEESCTLLIYNSTSYFILVCHVTLEQVVGSPVEGYMIDQITLTWCDYVEGMAGGMFSGVTW